MKNKHLLSLIFLLTLNLVLPTRIVVAESVQTQQADIESLVVNIFNEHTQDDDRIYALRKLQDQIAFSYCDTNGTHNWFQRARNMNAQEELALIKEYCLCTGEYEANFSQVDKVIRFLEDKIDFERKAAGKMSRAEEKEARKKENRGYMLRIAGLLCCLGAMKVYEYLHKSGSIV